MHDHITKSIAEQIKQRRKTRGWSLDKLSVASGVSKAMLGQIERQESSPTVATLWKIATGLECSFSGLLSRTDASPYCDDEELARHEDNFRVKTLFAFNPDSGFEMFELTLLNAHTQWSDAHATGVYEHVVVQHGELLLYYDEQWHTLKEGESARFHANQRHGYKTNGQQTRFIDVISYP